ncbi:hypothetical protein FQN60_002709 [Etheostoma spectabile]|uniref:Uncharacterized protein n=1 Tax=Etheostoma spectabile TaxID=54343 RepID=A0A5J5CH47_9PERO|nr:hypothetical protein FQN60_002709 [Etheostoma spectabile]
MPKGKIKLQQPIVSVDMELAQHGGEHGEDSEEAEVEPGLTRALDLMTTKLPAAIDNKLTPLAKTVPSHTTELKRAEDRLDEADAEMLQEFQKNAKHFKTLQKPSIMVIYKNKNEMKKDVSEEKAPASLNSSFINTQKSRCGRALEYGAGRGTHERNRISRPAGEGKSDVLVGFLSSPKSSSSGNTQGLISRSSAVIYGTEALEEKVSAIREKTALEGSRSETERESAYPLSVDEEPVDDAASRTLAGSNHHDLWLFQQGAHKPGDRHQMLSRGMGQLIGHM